MALTPTYSIPTPYKCHINGLMVQVDSSGHIFAAGRVNDKNYKGTQHNLLWEVVNGKSVPIDLDPEQSYGTPEFQVFGDGYLYLVTCNEASNTIKAFKVPGWTPGKATSTTTTSTVDQTARNVAQDAQNKANQAINSINALRTDTDNKLKQSVAELRNDISNAVRELKTFATDIAWSKGLDAANVKITERWNAWVSYADPRLLNVIYNRWLKHAEDKYVVDPGSKRATPEKYE